VVFTKYIDPWILEFMVFTKYIYPGILEFMVFTKYIDPWILEFVVLNTTSNNQWEIFCWILIFVV
jgi:hypothetical protein